MKQVGFPLMATLLTFCLPCGVSGKHLRRREETPAHLTAAMASATKGNHSAFPWVQKTHNQVPAQLPGPNYAPPRVFFLFLAVDKVSNLDVWKAFFAQAPPSQYKAYVHCKLPECNTQVQGSPLTPVPTVPSYYCTDLVSPMNQLIASALHDAGPGNPQDKFAFVSDSSLPAKPFSVIYSILVSRQGSDFCIFPSNEWADLPVSAGYGMEIAPKHHQWITLERSHAEKASYLWAGGQMHDFMSRFWMNMNAYTWSNNTFADHRNFGCLDEFWYFIALYGTMISEDSRIEKLVNLPQFTGSPLKIGAGVGWQGSCDTFVIWAKYLHTPGYNPFERLHASLDPPSIPHGGNDQRPGWWDTISTTGIRALRASDFLFVRKFIDNPALAGGGNFADAYGKFVLSS